MSKAAKKFEARQRKIAQRNQKITSSLSRFKWPTKINRMFYANELQIR